MTAYARAARRYNRADKAAEARILYLLAHTTADPRAAFQDAHYRAARAHAGRLWHRLSETMRAAVLNPDRED